MSSIKLRIEKLLANIAQAEKEYQRKPGSVALVIVSKARNTNEMLQVIQCGQLQFAENYLQEALTKIHAISNPNVIWHYIGKIQTSKTKTIAKNFSWVQSVASIVHAKLLGKWRSKDQPALNVCIQVNIGNEITKGGIAAEQILSLAQAIATEPQLKLRGLMAIPPICHSFAEQIKSFQFLKQEFDKLVASGFAIDTLSMGMSNDYQAAIAAGSTMLRIGTAVFGTRDQVFKFDETPLIKIITSDVEANAVGRVCELPENYLVEELKKKQEQELEKLKQQEDEAKKAIKNAINKLEKDGVLTKGALTKKQILQAEKIFADTYPEYTDSNNPNNNLVIQTCIALLGVMNVHIAGTIQPVVQYRWGNPYGIIDVNPSDGAVTGGAEIDQANRIDTVRGDPLGVEFAAVVRGLQHSLPAHRAENLINALTVINPETHNLPHLIPKLIR